jgi:hypothetical protein
MDPAVDLAFQRPDVSCGAKKMGVFKTSWAAAR